ncbi:unnamed protein product, partial [Dibothriocephalus latus]
MTPLTLFIYGRFFLDVQQIRIPYLQIAGQLLYVVIPVIAAALPWIGFLLAGLITFLLRRSRAEVLTIAIETGIQNIGIAILVLIYSMPQPEGDIGAVMALIVALLTPSPLMIAAIFVCVQAGECCACCYCRKEHQDTPPADKMDQVVGQIGVNEDH